VAVPVWGHQRAVLAAQVAAVRVLGMLAQQIQAAAALGAAATAAQVVPVLSL
jgi:hypothetical protein